MSIHYYTDASLRVHHQVASSVFVKTKNGNLLDIHFKNFRTFHSNITVHEVQAANLALKDAEENGHEDFTIFSDCQYTCNAFRNANIKIKKVKAHSDNAGNILADLVSGIKHPLILKAFKKKLYTDYMEKPLNRFSIELIRKDFDLLQSQHNSLVMFFKGKENLKEKSYNKIFNQFVNA